MDEKKYQDFIDELHKEIDSLHEIVTAQADKLDEYEEAIIDAFKKWSRI